MVHWCRCCRIWRARGWGSLPGWTAVLTVLAFTVDSFGLWPTLTVVPGSGPPSRWVRGLCAPCWGVGGTLTGMEAYVYAFWAVVAVIVIGVPTLIVTVWWGSERRRREQVELRAQLFERDAG